MATRYEMNAPTLNSLWVSNTDNQTYKVVGFKTIWNGRHGVEVVRFIKSRDAFAKTPVCFTYLDEGEDGQTHDMFHNVFTAK